MAEQAKMVQMIASDHGGPTFPGQPSRRIATSFGGRAMTSYYADKALREGGQLWATDVCVPISRLAECITETQKDIAASFLPAPIVGHAGDGNFHVGFMLNPNDPKEMAEAERLNQRLVHRALSLDGTCTGEHGIGCGKIDFLLAEHGEAVSVMRAIKTGDRPRQHHEPGQDPPDLGFTLDAQSRSVLLSADGIRPAWAPGPQLIGFGKSEPIALRAWGCDSRRFRRVRIGDGIVAGPVMLIGSYRSFPCVAPSEASFSLTVEKDTTDIQRTTGREFPYNRICDRERRRAGAADCAQYGEAQKRDCQQRGRGGRLAR